MTKQFLLLLTISLSMAIGASAQKDDLSKVDFKDRTYSTSVCSRELGLPRSVKVVEGEFKEDENYFRVRDEIVYGTLAGRQVAVVHATCGSTAGNFFDSEIYVFGLEKGKAVLLARVDTTTLGRDHKRYFKGGFVVAVEGAAIKKGSLVVTAYTDGSNASPKYKSAMSYKLGGGKLTISGKPVRRSSEI